MGDEVDLDALLESALEDFRDESAPPKVERVPHNTHPATQPQPAPPRPNPAPPAGDLPDFLSGDPMKAINEMLSNPQLMGELEKDLGNLMKEMNLPEMPLNLSELESMFKDLSTQESSPAPRDSSTNQPTPESNPTAEPEGISESLESLLNSAKDVLSGSGDGDFSPDSFSKMFSDLESNPEMLDMMQNVMEKFMSKDVLEEGLVELQEKFVEWFEKNKANLSQEDQEKYSKQIESLDTVLKLSSSDDPSADSQMQEMMKQFDTLGTLPEDLLTELGKDGQTPCSIM